MAGDEDWSGADADCVFTAYFEGTANAVDRRMTQIGLFYELDRALDVGTSEDSARDAARKARASGPLRFKMALNGCGYENGLAGIVFAYGMSGQCADVVRLVRAVRAALGEPRMLLNVVGLSRGAVAALTIAAMAGDEPELFISSAVSRGREESHDRDKSPPTSAASLSDDDYDDDTIVLGTGTERTYRMATEAAVPEAVVDFGRDEALAASADWFLTRSKDLLSSSAGVLSAVGTETSRVARASAHMLSHEARARSRDEKVVARATARILIRQRLRINLLLFDPVPGNQILTTQLDPLGYTTAASGLDVRSSAGVLRRVLAIYPYEPLPAITFHAPLVPSYPPGCEVEEVVSLGCHQGAILCAPNRISCRLSYVMIRSFLLGSAVRLRGCLPFDDCLTSLSGKLRVLEMLRIAAAEDARKHGAQPNAIFISRAAHSKSTYVRRLAAFITVTAGRHRPQHVRPLSQHLPRA